MSVPTKRNLLAQRMTTYIPPNERINPEKRFSKSFTIGQRQALRRLGVVQEQIERLDSVVGVAWPLFSSARVATTSYLRDKLTGLKSSLAESAKRLDSVIGSPVAEMEDVRDLLRNAATQIGTDACELERTIHALSAASALVAAACDAIPKKQLRHQARLNIVVRWIDHALLKGWELSRASGVPRPRSLPERGSRAVYPFPPSRTPESRFKQVADICFAAMRGVPAGKAERAIRKYIATGQAKLRPSLDETPPMKIAVRFKKYGQLIRFPVT